MAEPRTEIEESVTVASSHDLRTREFHRGWKGPWKSSSPTHTEAV